MIRRLLVAATLVTGLGLAAAPAAGASPAVPTQVTTAGNDVFCLWSIWPLNQGLCLSI